MDKWLWSQLPGISFLTQQSSFVISSHHPQESNFPSISTLWHEKLKAGIGNVTVSFQASDIAETLEKFLMLSKKSCSPKTIILGCFYFFWSNEVDWFDWIMGWSSIITIGASALISFTISQINLTHGAMKEWKNSILMWRQSSWKVVPWFSFQNLSKQRKNLIYLINTTVVCIVRQSIPHIQSEKNKAIR